MSKPEPKWTRGQLRIWLKWVLQSGLLDRLPPHYDPEGASQPATPEEVARRLLAGLQDPELKGPALAPVMAEARQFHDWVQARQKKVRQLILAERDSANLDPNWLENWAVAMIGAPGQDPPGLARRGAMPRPDPMWDEDLDG